MHRICGGCEVAQAVLQASAGREVLYTGPVRSLARRCRVPQAARECGELGNGNCGLHRALLGWVVEAVGNGRARFRAARNFARVAAKVGNASHLSR